jgi:integrase
MKGKNESALLPLAQTYSQPKVNVFLASIARNSRQSARIYGFALSHFQRFLSNKCGPYFNIDLIIDSVITCKINVYTLLDDFVSFLRGNGEASKLSSNSIQIYVAAVRSFLQYYDIDIVSSKFKRRVKLPKNHREDEQPIAASDIRRILLSCSNRRLKAYLLVLASGGMRAMEALAIRYCDLDFSMSPTKVKIRKEFAKNRVSREVYISDEATDFLRQWLEWKSRKNDNSSLTSSEELVFTTDKDTNIPAKLSSVYSRVLQEFNIVLKIVGMDQRKEGMSHRKITFHSFRRHAKGVLSNQVNTDYSAKRNWISSMLHYLKS